LATDCQEIPGKPAQILIRLGLLQRIHIVNSKFTSPQMNPAESAGEMIARSYKPLWLPLGYKLSAEGL
jgi:glycerol uptake facilitator-like aquaporin